MVRLARALLLTLSMTAVAVAGCIGPEDTAPAATAPDVLTGVTGLLPISIENVMNFTQSVVTPAVGLAADLYEPTMEVSDSGTLYVAGHVIGAATTGTPAYYSNDDGATWAPLPFLASLQTPSPLQGSQPPPGDEGFIVAGENGQAWMADIYAAGFSITGWCGDGAEQCYDNRWAYDRAATITGCNPDLVEGLPVTPPASLNDRPWAAYGGGSLLLVNNPGGGPMQIGIMDVPPATPVGIGGGTASVSGPTWNTCASPGGWIPGIPSMRPDGLFAVPQMTMDLTALQLTLGNKADIFAVETVTVFPVTSTGSGTSNGGRTAFDADGALYVGARNNTEDEAGQFIIAVSADDGKTFQNVTVATSSLVQSLYLDGNMYGPGALLTWSQVGDADGTADWYVAHVFVGEDGAPVIQHATLAVDDGPPFSAHVMGAAVGPDGRAYFLNFVDNGDAAAYAGSTPISVWIQQDGETLPVTMAPAEEEAPEAS